MRNVLLLLLLPSLWSQATERFYLGTGDISGIYYQIGGEFCRLATQANHQNRCAVVPSSGSIENLALLKSGKVNIAMVQSDWAYQAFRGSGVYHANPQPQLRALFATHAEPFALVVRADAKLRQLGDLAGQRLYLGPAGSGTRQTALTLLRLSGLTPKAIQEVKTDDPGEALCRGQIAMFAMVSGHPNRTLVDTAKQCDIRFLPIPPDTITKLLVDAPYYQRSQIPARLYPGNLQPTPTFAVAAILLTTAEAPDAGVYQMVKGMLGEGAHFNQQTFAYANLFRLPRYQTGKVLPITQHPGALRFFQELKQAGKL